MSSASDLVDIEHWSELASCNGADVNLFFDNYETDVQIAINVDQMCLYCPVARQCLADGMDGKEQGVWGGVYLKDGSVDKVRNSHKTPAVWNRLKMLHGDRIAD